MLSSGMLRRVPLVRIYVSEDRVACIIRVTRIGELGTMLAVTSIRNTLQYGYCVPRNQFYHFMLSSYRECLSLVMTSVLTVL
jgi:hypothetical protein